MKVRAKESRLAVADRGQSSDSQCSDLGGSRRCSISPPPTEANEAEREQCESGSGATRCSLRLIHDVVCNFNSKKKDLVKSIGFEGILQIPCINQVNRKFVMRLMRCVDVESCTLIVSDGIRIGIHKEDVRDVFGVPCSGKKVIEGCKSRRNAKEKVLNDIIGNQFRENRSIKLVQEIVERDYGEGMSKLEEDSFRAAFAIFVVSTLLSPGAKHDYASIDYWQAIEDPGSIGKYDWSEYVVTRLLEGVRKLKQDISSGIKFPNITGCSLFLLVLYLDSIDLGMLTLAHDSFPRIRDFSYDRLRIMIRSDPYQAANKSPQMLDNSLKLRDPSSCCYKWALLASCPEHDVSRSANSLAIFEAAVAMARLLNIPIEAAGPIFVAASDFQHQVDSGVRVSGIRAIKYMSVLVSILLSFKNGYRYDFSLDDEGAQHGGASSSSGMCAAVSRGLRLLSVPLLKKRRLNGGFGAEQESHIGVVEDESNEGSVQYPHPLVMLESNLRLHHRLSDDSVLRSMKRALASMHEIPIDLNVNQRLATVMSQFYCFVRRLRLPAEVDLNSLDVEEHRHMIHDKHGMLSSSSSPPSPWQLGFAWTVDPCGWRDILSIVEQVCDDQGYIIVHWNPKHAQVSMRAFRSQILGTSEFELDLFDVFIRRLKQEDDGVYKNIPMHRWRHFFESGFMALILSGNFDLLGMKIRSHFLPSILPYDISSCKLLFFPALLQFRWVCYVWCLESNVLRVFDPSYAICVPDHMAELHEKNCHMLKLAMHSVCTSLFKSWKYDWISADVQITTWLDSAMTGCNRTGVMCALFCAAFDGDDIMASMDMVDAGPIAAKICRSVLQLEGNMGLIPNELQRCILSNKSKL